MSHICLLYTIPDRAFARHLAVQLTQRGLVVHPVWEYSASEPVPPDPTQGLHDASHALLIVSTAALSGDELDSLWQQAQAVPTHPIVITRDDAPLPPYLQNVARIRFDGPFLLAVEDLVRRLEKSQAPTRPLTVESPPPVSKSDLLPIKLPSERCWREDRLRINYNLPIIIDMQDLALHSPHFLDACGFEVIRETRKAIRLRRTRKYPLFDPRRSNHTLTLRPRKGRLQVYYRMARIQVWTWFPAHYRVLDREAAALYRYLVLHELDPDLFEHVWRQAKRARIVSWSTLLLAILVPLAILAVLVL